MFRLFGLSPLLLASQIAPVATAYGNEADVIDLLSTGRIKTSATWCYKKPGPERCSTTLRVKDGSLFLDGVGCGSFRVPLNGSNGRQTAKISGNTLTVTVTGKDGTGVNSYELSSDLSSCSHIVHCPAGFQAKVFSCSVERSSQAAALQNPNQRPQPNDMESHLAPRIDAQSYLDAVKDLKDREPSYHSLLAAVQTLRRAAAAFDAGNDVGRARAASGEAQVLENEINTAARRLGLSEDRNQCSTLRGSALECYSRATRIQHEVPRAGIAGALLDCVKTYCTAMRRDSCPMPLFGTDNAGFCFATPIGEPDLTPQDGAAAKPRSK